MTDRPVSNPAAGRARITLWALFAAFFWLGCTSFGGGTAGWLHRDLVERRRWIDDAAFLAAMSLGQTLPGANGIKTSLLIGQHLCGVAGAVAAVLALLAGPFLIIIAIGAAYAELAGEPLVHAVLDGVTAAVIGLTLATGWRSLAAGAPGPLALGFAAATVLCVGVLRWPIVPVILVLAPLNIGVCLRQARRARDA